MDDFKVYLPLFVLVCCSWVIVVGGSDSGSLIPCMQQLLPCQPYLKLTSRPPAPCCVPLKKMVSEDSKCLCDVFNNPNLLQKLNITQEDALKLPRACGANPDISICKASPPATPSNSSSPGGSTKKNAANGIHPAGFLVAFLLSALWAF